MLRSFPCPVFSSTVRKGAFAIILASSYQLSAAATEAANPVAEPVKPQLSVVEPVKPHLSQVGLPEPTPDQAPQLAQRPIRLGTYKQAKLTGVSDRANDLQTDLTVANWTPQPLITAEATEMLPQKNADASSEGAAATTATQDVAAQSQNPISSLISVPIENDVNFGQGEFNRTGYVLSLKPVVPTPIGKNLTLVNRLILPLTYQPEIAPGVGRKFGLADSQYQGYFVPKSKGNLTWGIGPTLTFPTATATSLGAGKWGAGPGAVVVLTKKPIVMGALVNNVWSYAGDSSRPSTSVMTIQPFFNYNLSDGWYVATVPVITANWNASAGNKWTLPIGGGFGRVFKIGEQHVNMSLRGYWNAVRPDGAPSWQIQAWLILLFPDA